MREDLFSKFADSPIFKRKPKAKKHFVLHFMNWLCQPCVFWEWTDFGIVLKIYQNTKYVDYHISIDIQIAWFNLWLQCFKKSK